MKRVLKTAVVLMLTAVLAVPAVGYAFGGNTKGAALFQNRPVNSGQVTWESGAVLSSLSIHRQAYIKLLAEKYTPATVSAWETEFARTNDLLQEARESGTGAEIKEKIMYYQQLLQEGEITRQELREELRNMLPDYYSDAERRALIEEQIQTQINLSKEFTAAIQSGDADQIATVLDQLLAQQRERNDRLADFIAASTNTD
jgi:DNA repair ATPase RecN